MRDKRTILVIDDSPVNRMLLTKLLDTQYDIAEAENGLDGLEVLSRTYEDIACVILDISMPVMDGFGFLERFSRIDDYSDIPVLVATGEVDSDVEKRCLRLGAWDFIVKPYDADILRLRLIGIIGRSRIAGLEKVKYIAEHDRLTGLYNKERYFEATRDLIDANPDIPFAFIHFDIDRFRLINSFLGAKKADSLLRFIADFIRSEAHKRKKITFGRIESDVFCMCMPYDTASLEPMLNEIQKAVSEFDSSYYIVPSFGVYVVNDPGISIEEMFSRASLASQSCKSRYLQSISYYTDEMSAGLFAEQEILNEMHGALESGQFIVYFQPKYNLKTSRPDGAEALVRWLHPTKGLISPGRFIPVFERNGFIGRLDFYIWERTCMFLKKWRDEGLDPSPVSVNISRVNMYNPRLVPTLRNLTAKYSLPPSLLNLELTESAYMDNPDSCAILSPRFKARALS